MEKVETITFRVLKKVYRKRDKWCRKFNFGHLLIIGGSIHYSGSPALAALAALRAGVDLVTIIAPKRAADIIASFKPDLIAYPVECDYFTPSKIDDVLEFFHKKDALVIGGGMLRKEEVKEFITKVIEKVEIPCVIDADAIYAIAENKKCIKGKEVIITPHAYEFFILSGERVKENLEDRIKKAKKIASELNCTILLKGHIDVIACKERIAINETGSVYMTKGGTGDTLAGICGAFLARGVDCFTAACAAAWLNGKAGEFAARKYGESLLASDLIEEIPNVLRKYLEIQ